MQMCTDNHSSDRRKWEKGEIGCSQHKLFVVFILGRCSASEGLVNTTSLCFPSYCVLLIQIGILIRSLDQKTISGGIADNSASKIVTIVGTTSPS
jgi:hypothetical protein